MDFIDRITGNRKQGWHTRPWRTRLPGGIYLTRDKDAWMYRIMELSSLEWEDAPKRLNDQQRFERLIIELGDTSRDLGQGTRSLTQARHLHIVSMLVDHPSVLDTSITPELEALHQQLTPLTTTMKYVFVGVKLRRDAMAALMTSDSDDGGWSRMKRAVKSMRDDDVSAYQLDIEKIGNILARSGATEPTDDDLNWLESWFNNGKGVDVTLAASDTRIKLPDTSGWQLSAFMGIDEQDMWLSSPDAAWALDAMNHPDGADVVSIRCALEPSTVTRSRLRRSQRIIAAQEEEEEATGDIARDELGERRHKAKDVENYTRSAGHAWLTNTSVLFARKLGMDGTRAPDETFADNIGSAYGMAVKPLEKRQLQALAEMLPGESPIVNPFLQDVNPAWVAYAGLTGFGDVGDDTGLLLGESAPHYTPVRVDYLAAAKKNKGPAMCVFGRPGSGKASSVDALVLTPRGWKRMGDVAVGDTITGSDGRSQEVLGVFPQGEQDLYTVTFSDGSSTQVTGDHWWTVTTSGAKSAGRTATLRTTLELQADLVDGTNKRKWRIPMMAPAQFPATRLPLDPYLLGALLGDGGLTTYVGFSNKDHDVLDRVRLSLPPMTKLVSAHKPHDYRIVRTDEAGPNKVMNTLRAMNLFGHKSIDKHIPSLYLRAPLEHRVALLQGLMDTDGEVTTHNSIMFSTSSPQLRDGMVALVQSLGGTARTGQARRPFYVHNEQRRQGLPAWRISIRLPAHIEPFHCKRKAVAFNADTRYEPVRVVAKIEKTGRGLAQCIKVSNADSLYITDDYIATHNTFAAQFIAGQAALNGTASILINPKGHDSLAPFAHWVTRSGGQAQIVSLSKLEEQGGAFDPFRFCEPRMAAEVLDRHIVSVLGQSVNGGMTGRQETELSRGLAEGADKGALCAAQALAYVRDDDVRDMVLAMAESNSLFRLGFGFTPQQAWGTTGGFTLIEFDREMAWPTAGKNPADYDRPERVAVAALRLVSRASLEILMRAGGGVLVVDEAHHFLASAEGRATVDRINREGRSLKLLPIFCTQRVTDLVNDSAVDMETFISRVLVLNLPDHNESAAALTLCGLAPTDSRVSYLRTSPSGWGFFRDIDDRHSIVHVGAGISSELHQAMSTNYTDRQARDDVS